LAHRFCDVPVAGGAGIGAGVEHAVAESAAVHARCLDHDQSGAAGRARLVVGGQARVRQPAGQHIGLMAGREDAVADLDRADGQW
jgi:hypothetical protein